MLSYQGNLDGLCGQYAIVNAYEHCGVGDSQMVFQAACEALAARRWPSVLWEGTTFGDLKRMLANCKRSQASGPKIFVSYPFHRNPPKTNTEYWSVFDGLFDDYDYDRCCAIIGMEHPHQHWIVAYREKAGGRLHFKDANPKKSIIKKNRPMLRTGIRREGNAWVLNPKEVAFVFAE